MIKSSLILLASAIAILPWSQSFAADYDPPIYVDDAPEYVPVEIGSGWYLRGDVGYNFAGRHNSDTYTLGPVDYENNFRDALTAGVGFGYHFTDMLRADVSLDRIFGSDFNSRQLVTPPAGPCLGYGEYIDPNTGTSYIDDFSIDNCLREDSASYNAWLVMGNAYVDLGTYAGFTPYVGAGLGFGRIAWKEESGSTICVPQDADAHFEGCSATGSLNQPAPNTVYTEPGLQNSGVDYRIAWSVTAGLSYLLSQNVSVDTSYRYTSVAGSNDEIVYNNTPGSSIANDGFAVHQVKVGLRYDLW